MRMIAHNRIVASSIELPTLHILGRYDVRRARGALDQRHLADRCSGPKTGYAAAAALIKDAQADINRALRDKPHSVPGGAFSAQYTGLWVYFSLKQASESDELAVIKAAN